MNKAIDQMADRVFQAVDAHIARRMQPLHDRIKELEGRPQIEYKGVWRCGEVYPVASLVTHAGSMWFATNQTNAKPGSGPGCGWSLSVKSGSAPRERD